MGSAEPFQHTDLPSLTDVLQAAHANGSHRAAALAAKSLIARKWLDGHGAVWPLLLHYLEERDRDQICVDLVRGNVLPTPQPQDFIAEAFCHLLVHTPTDVYRTTAKPLDLTLDGVDLTSATLPLETVCGRTCQVTENPSSRLAWNLLHDRDCTALKWPCSRDQLRQPKR